ncbi:MAG TPA: hypothetical protein VHU88_12060 [Sporichthyaceae bacterium]|jgi:Tfp pilus assembly protein PilN|nr:hypothetical protein [Sporichthyaceae bacterium]
MNERLNDIALKVMTAGFITAGLIAVTIGYRGIQREDDIVLQMPYLASGAVIGLALIALGGITMIRQQMREQSRRGAQVTETLEEWKESTMNELRAFLANATVDVEINPTAPAHLDALNRAPAVH